MFRHSFLDTLSIFSLIGIWPRFIEPRLLKVTTHQIKIPELPQELHGLKILQISDLHFNRSTSKHTLEKLIKKTKALTPDIIVFTGDFLCYGKLDDQERLKNFLNQFHAPYGCFGIFGNHDYDSYVSVNAEGDYDVICPQENNASVYRGFKRLLQPVKLSSKRTERVSNVSMNQPFIELLSHTAIRILHNETITIKIKNHSLNITGLGEYTIGNTNPKQAFAGYKNEPGIILLHNPDGLPLLKNCPGNLILCGHTHGGQINLPWIWKKLTLLENPQWKKGLFKVDEKWVYVNRGIGGVVPFRFFSPPELSLMILN